MILKKKSRILNKIRGIKHHQCYECGAEEPEYRMKQFRVRESPKDNGIKVWFCSKHWQHYEE